MYSTGPHRGGVQLVALAGDHLARRFYAWRERRRRRGEGAQLGRGRLEDLDEARVRDLPVFGHPRVGVGDHGGAIEHEGVDVIAFAGDLRRMVG